MKPISCFLIDDDPEEHFIFSLALEETGLDIRCAYFQDCHRAIGQLSVGMALGPQIIFVDANASGGGFTGFLAALSELSSYGDARIVIYTGFISPEMVRHFDRWGRWQLLLKNPSIAELASELKTVFILDAA